MRARTASLRGSEREYDTFDSAPLALRFPLACEGAAALAPSIPLRDEVGSDFRALAFRVAVAAVLVLGCDLAVKLAEDADFFGPEADADLPLKEGVAFDFALGAEVDGEAALRSGASERSDRERSSSAVRSTKTERPFAASMVPAEASGGARRGCPQVTSEKPAAVNRFIWLIEREGAGRDG